MVYSLILRPYSLRDHTLRQRSGSSRPLALVRGIQILSHRHKVRVDFANHTKSLFHIMTEWNYDTQSHRSIRLRNECVENFEPHHQSLGRDHGLVLCSIGFLGNKRCKKVSYHSYRHLKCTLEHTYKSFTVQIFLRNGRIE